MADIKKVISDPEFRSMSDGEKMSVWSEIDPEYAKLSDLEKIGVLQSTLNLHTPELSPIEQARQSAPGRFLSRMAEANDPRLIVQLAKRVATQSPMKTLKDINPMNIVNQLGSYIKEGDYASAGGMIAGAAVPFAVGKLGKIAGPSLKASAETSYARALAPTKETTKFITKEQIVPELLKRRVKGSLLGGLESLKKKSSLQAETAIDAINEAWDKIPDSQIVKTAPITSKMDDLISKFTALSKDNAIVDISPEKVSGLQRIRDTIVDLGDEVSPATLKKVRQVWDSEVAYAGGYAGKDLINNSKLFAREQGANAIRNALAENFPDIAKLNKEYTFWKRVENVTSATLKRKAGQSVPLGEQLATAAGGAAGLTKGIPEAALGAATFRLLTKAVRSPGWKMASADYKNRIAEALIDGRTIKAVALLHTVYGLPSRYRKEKD